MRTLMWISAVGLLIVIIAACGEVREQNSQGNSRYDDGDYEAALIAYQAAQVMAPDQPDAYFNAAAALIQIDDLEAAVVTLEQALLTADDELKADAYYNLGNVFYEIRRYNDAVLAYQQALLLRSDDAEARYNLELALLKAIPPTPTSLEQQTNPEMGQTDPDTTPTDQPRGFDGPTPTPPPLDVDLSATPDDGFGDEGEQGATPMPPSEGEMSAEQARRLLDQIQQDQQALSEYLNQVGAPGDPAEKDW